MRERLNKLIDVMSAIKLLPLGVIVLISVWACWPLFQNALPGTHDYIAGFMKHLAMRDFFGRGQFLPVWVPDYYYGYGGAVFNFYPPLFYLLSFIIGALGVSAMLAINVACFLVVLASGLAMYWFLKEITTRSGALLGAVAYILAPYHMVDLYVRGAWAELMAFLFLPLILLGLLRMAKEGSFKAFVLVAVSVAGLGLSHNVLLLIIFPFAAAYFGVLSFLSRSWIIFFKGIGAVMLGLGLVSFFFMPALWEQKYVIVSQMTEGLFDFHRHLLHPLQFFLSYEQSSALIPSITCNTVPFELGWIYILGGLAGTVCVYLFSSKQVRWHYVFMCLGIFFTLWMMTPSSLFLWERVPLIKMVQFPWRLLVLTTFFIAVLIAGLGLIPQRRERIILCALSIFLIFSMRISDCKPSSLDPLLSVKVIGDFWELPRAVWLEPVYKPKIAKHLLNVVPKEHLDFPVGMATLVTYDQRSPVDHHFTVVAATNTFAAFNNYYFPGWHVLVDEKESQLVTNEYGIILFPLTQGKHDVRVYFGPSPVRVVGGWVSFICFLGLLVMAWKKRQA